MSKIEDLRQRCERLHDALCRKQEEMDDKLDAKDKEIAHLERDRDRLDWLLQNINRKGFDDLACGICSRDDIDKAIEDES